MFAAIQDPETARELSSLCGEYGAIARSESDSSGTSARPLFAPGGGVATRSRGRSENRSEIRRALIKPDEILQDTRTDEAFVFVRGRKPLRCGRAIYFRRPDMVAAVDTHHFNRQPDDAPA